MRLLLARLAVGAAIAAVIAVGLFYRWESGRTVGRYRARVLDLCSVALAEATGTASVQALRAELVDRWQWGCYAFPSRLFGDRLPHDTATFDAIRVSRHERLPGTEGQCRLAMCVYSIVLDRAAARISEPRCGGGGATEMVTPTLKRDLLRVQ